MLVGGLFLRYPQDSAGAPLTIQGLADIAHWRSGSFSTTLVLNNFLTLEDNNLVEEETMNNSLAKGHWILVSKKPTSGTVNVDYLTQTEKLLAYFQKNFVKNKNPPQWFKQALKQFEEKKSEIREKMESGTAWNPEEEDLGQLYANINLRQNGVEAVYDLLMYHLKNGINFLSGIGALTNSCSNETKGSLRIGIDEDRLTAGIVNFNGRGKDSGAFLCIKYRNS